MSEDLNATMEVDHVIEVREGGEVRAARGVHAPELHQWEDDDGVWHEQLYADGWTLLTGWTGQYGYNGPMMHASEYVGGGLERHIRETPGLYVVLVPGCTDRHDEPAEPDEWAIAYREEA